MGSLGADVHGKSLSVPANSENIYQNGTSLFPSHHVMMGTMGKGDEREGRMPQELGRKVYAQ